MINSRGFAVLALAAAASTMVIAAPAQAQARAGDQARYAWVKGCAKRDYTVPCGPWTLTLSSGKDLVLKDAVVHPKTAGGKVDKEASAPIAISGNGAHVAYFRKSDGRLVTRDLAKGTVKPLPGDAARLPKGIGMADIDLALSNDGGKLFVDYFDADSTRKSVVANLRNGALTRIPGAEVLQGFSPSGEYVLTSRTTEDNTTEFAVYDASGSEVESRVVPQVVSNNAPIALNDDAKTVAVLITGPNETDRARLRTYDLTEDTVSDAVKLSYAPKREYPARLSWVSGDGLTLWTFRTDAEGNPIAAVRRNVNPDTGAAVKQDSFSLRKNAWTWWLPGD
ncbi:hypothetical protein [Thermoactinospora rubra]|uniref:hypothetical protein n=1 Tax=Thermoactinospora rubra TaxID=1088767 RepID=UPI000A11F027|nr:hypothetical protein [Thermoactinospora rubra]